MTENSSSYREAGVDTAAGDLAVELMKAGILDSISVMQLVSFMEEKFGVSFAAHELGVDYMNTLPDIAKLVASKL